MVAHTLDQRAQKLAFPNMGNILNSGAGFFGGILGHGPVLWKYG